MRIALFTDTYMPQINGVTNTINNLIRYYDQNGIEYRLFAPKYSEEHESQNIERFYSIKFLLYPENRLAIPSRSRIDVLLSEFQPDIIHIMTEFNMGLAGLNYGRKNGIPIVTNYTTNFSQYADYYKLNIIKQPLWHYLKWFHTQANISLCPSEVTRQLLDSKGIHNTEILSRGIDFDNFHPMKRSRDLREQYGVDEKLVFLYVGRVCYEKDLDILNKSYREVMEQYGERVALIITGDGPYTEKCKQMFPEGTMN